MARRTAAPAAPFEFVSAELPEADLVDVGSRYAVASLEKMANALLKLSARSKGFEAFGFTPAWRAGLAAKVSAMTAGVDRKRALRDGLLPTGEALDSASARAKAWRRSALVIVRNSPALRDRLTHASTGRSFAKLTASVAQLIPLVGHAKAQGSGGSAARQAEGEALLTELRAASRAHDSALLELPPEVRALNAVKGLVYEELKRLAVAARDVVPDQSAKYAVSTHLRTHRRKPAPKTPAAPPAAPA